MVAVWVTVVGADLDFGELVAALSALLALMVAGYVGVILVRRRFRQTQQPMPTEAFTLDQLRELHASGQLTEAEYERARAKMAERLSIGEPDGAAADEDPPGGQKGLPQQ